MTAWLPRAAPPDRCFTSMPGSELHASDMQHRTGSHDPGVCHERATRNPQWRWLPLLGCPALLCGSAEGGTCWERAEAAARAVVGPAVTPLSHDSSRTKLKESEIARRNPPGWRASPCSILAAGTWAPARVRAGTDPTRTSSPHQRCRH